jgi:hypothetical protein
MLALVLALVLAGPAGLAGCRLVRVAAKASDV